MTCAQRIRMIRLMDKMELSNVCQKSEDNKVEYVGKNGNVLIKVEMKKS